MVKITLKKGPRGGKILSGRCVCDAPATAHDVRRMRVCDRCGDVGLDLLAFGMGRYHARCIARMHGMLTLAQIPGGVTRVGLCCLGKRRMAELLRFCDMARGRG